MKQPVPVSVPVPEPIVLECDLSQPPALVWRALTERELLAAWLLPNDLRAEVGARFTLGSPDRVESRDQRHADERQSDGSERSDRGERSDPIDCEVLAVDPERTLRWRQTEPGDAASGWQPVTSVVTIELTDNTAGGTHLRLVHDEFAIVATATPVAVAPVTAQVIPFKRRSTASKRSVASILTGPDIVCQLRRAA